MKALSIHAAVSWLTQKAVWKQHCGGHAANAAKRDTGPNLRALKLTEIQNVFILYVSYAPCVYHIVSSQSPLKNMCSTSYFSL